MFNAAGPFTGSASNSGVHAAQQNLAVRHSASTITDEPIHPHFFAQDCAAVKQDVIRGWRWCDQLSRGSFRIPGVAVCSSGYGNDRPVAAPVVDVDRPSEEAADELNVGGGVA